MYDILNSLLDISTNVTASKGKNSEIFGVLLKLKNPLARISRTETKGKPFSALGELLWYLSGSNELSFIQYYIKYYSDCSDDGKTIQGAYGPRIFNMHDKFNQLENVIKLLKENPQSRRAVISLFDASDLEMFYDSKENKRRLSKDIPCTCFLQFTVRSNKLNLYVSMRSNDAYVGLPHDIFCFTMIQELVAKSLQYDMGEYYHSVSSLHLYEKDYQKARNYINEGYQSTSFQMPAMPDGNPWEKIEILKSYETKIRNGEDFNLDDVNTEAYWYDLLLLIKIHSLYKSGLIDKIEELKCKVSSSIYTEYIEKKILDSIAKFAKKEE
ncbi:thymidylate synthase [Flavobacterium litorale]|uniref:thymidylate synthase n=1 Tax=Flavobacterium litorale TaxID=2856519 RepID=A0ABX8VA90_9FLAO|nr:thymidylate synthase [Flavobacterium litorale]QYJ67720.1 thymidylate synthase [Flavobacterium litorale]